MIILQFVYKLPRNLFPKEIMKHSFGIFHKILSDFEMFGILVIDFFDAVFRKFEDIRIGKRHKNWGMGSYDELRI